MRYVVTSLLVTLSHSHLANVTWRVWYQALLFGALLSATDPVAEVAVLHEVRPLHVENMLSLCHKSSPQDVADLCGLEQCSALPTQWQWWQCCTRCTWACHVTLLLCYMPHCPLWWYICPVRS
jgi:hypothetical protein